MKINKIIVTGGNGFIGMNLILALLQNKSNLILNIDNLTYASNNDFILKKYSNYKFVKENIIFKNKIIKIFKKFKPNIIFHLAAESHVDRSILKSNRFINTNIVGTYSLVECFNDYIASKKKLNNKIYKFIYISTDEVYGDNILKKNYRSVEDDRFFPSSPYSSTKASSEMIINAWYRTFKFPSIICRPSNNYGPYQNKEKFIPVIISNFLQNSKIPVYGSGKQIRNWTFVNDTVNALIKIMDRSEIGKEYNISSDLEIENLKLIELIHSQLLKRGLIKNKNFKTYIDYVPDRLGHDLRYSIENKKIKKDLNWKSVTNIKNGINETINWYLKK